MSNPALSKRARDFPFLYEQPAAVGDGGSPQQVPSPSLPCPRSIADLGANTSVASLLQDQLHHVINDLLLVKDTNTSQPSVPSQQQLRLSGIEGEQLYVGLGGVILALHEAQRRPSYLKAGSPVIDLRPHVGMPSSPPPTAACGDSDQAQELPMHSRSDEYLMKRALPRAHKKGRFTLLEGTAGELYVRAVLALQTAPRDEGYAFKMLGTLLNLYEPAVKQAPSGECEFLYGRAGYLSALLHFWRLFDQESLLEPSSPIPADIHDGMLTVCSDVAAAIVEEGYLLAKANPQLNLTLLWAWHDKAYLGAVHGSSGILYTLAKIPPSFLDKADILLKERLAKAKIQLDVSTMPPIRRLIAINAKELSGLRFDRKSDASGADSSHPWANYPSSIGSRSGDKLVQLCHGAPGFAFLYSHLATFPTSDVGGFCVDETEQAEFSALASEAAECVWRRGLIDYSCGLCHGFSGNALVMLALYRDSKKKDTGTTGHWWFTKALHFALKGAGYLPKVEADRPSSLYEGHAGNVVLLLNLLDVIKEAQQVQGQKRVHHLGLLGFEL